MNSDKHSYSKKASGQTIKRISLMIREGRLITTLKYRIHELISNIRECADSKLKNRYNELLAILLPISSKPLVSVIMPAYNAADTILESVQSILDQQYPYLELLVIDDASTDDTLKKLEPINDPRLQIFKSAVNMGPYVGKNYGITHARGELIALQDADDVSTLDRIAMQVDYFRTKPKTLMVETGYQRINISGEPVQRIQYGNVTAMFRKDLIKVIGYFDSVRVAADGEFTKRIKSWYGRKSVGRIKRLTYYARTQTGSLTNKFRIGAEVRTAYSKSFTVWHKQCKKDNIKPLIAFPLQSRSFDAPASITIKFPEKLTPTEIFTKHQNTAWIINAAMATMPERIESLKLAIESIIDQVDKMYITLNSFTDIPVFLQHPKIELIKSQDYEDYGSNGRFINSVNWKGFMIMIDDDIVYPIDYVEKMIAALIKYRFNAVVGVHGILISENFISYFEKNSRKVYHFKRPLENDTPVHAMGCGTMAYHTNSINFDLVDFDQNYMTDLYVAKICQNKNIQMVAIRRKADWLKPIPIRGESLYQKYKNNDQMQTQLVKSIDWQIHFPE